MNALRCVFLALVLGASTASAEEALTRREVSSGAALGPVVLPAGALAYYGYVGLPELGGGFRQGFGFFEVEARARFNYLALAPSAEVLARARVWSSGPMELAPLVGFGVLWNSGARYIDPDNFTYVGLRPFVGAVFGYRLAEGAEALATIEVPYDLAVYPAGGGGKLNPLVGAGIELMLGEEFTGLVMGRAGLDLLLPPGSPAVARFGYEVRIGLGYRLF